MNPYYVEYRKFTPLISNLAGIVYFHTIRERNRFIRLCSEIPGRYKVVGFGVKWR